MRTFLKIVKILFGLIGIAIGAVIIYVLIKTITAGGQAIKDFLHI